MTAPAPLTPQALDGLEEKARAATPGPWDFMPGRNIVRAIREDLAVPLFEAQEPYCDPLLDAPTCRVGGKVVFRANSEAARQSAAMKQEHHNAAYIAALSPSAALALIAQARAGEEMREALEAIAEIQPKAFEGGLDMEAIEACPECQRYSGHPIQQGICSTHRRPIWDREAHDAREEKALGYRAKSIARTALSKGAGQ